jgi:hypothetical protein
MINRLVDQLQNEICDRFGENWGLNRPWELNHGRNWESNHSQVAGSPSLEVIQQFSIRLGT